MSLFSFKKLSSLASAFLITTTSFISPSQANGIGIVDSGFLFADADCLRGYRTYKPKKLWKGGCFDKRSPFEPCRASIQSWTALQTNTNRNCLDIWGGIALNSQSGDFIFWGQDTFYEVQVQYAYHLSRNQQYMETLDSLDQAELKKLAATVSKPWK